MYEALCHKYSMAKMIVGGVGITGFRTSWLDQFALRIITQPAGWHIHSYLEGGLTVDFWRTVWTRTREMFSGELWLTEFNDVQGNNFQGMLDAVQAFPFDRYAVFTNRCTVGRIVVAGALAAAG